MVLQRTIDNLRERPKDERRAVALGVSAVTVILLLLGWGVFFVRNLSTVSVAPVGDVYRDAVQTASAAAADSTGWYSESAAPGAVVDQAAGLDGGQLQVIEQSSDQTLQ